MFFRLQIDIKGKKMRRYKHNQMRRWRRRRKEQDRQQKMITLLTVTDTSAPPPSVPSLLSLENMLMVCKENWSSWLAQVTATRMKQVTALAQSPSMKQIELLLDLEKLGKQIELVGIYSCQEVILEKIG